MGNTLEAQFPKLSASALDEQEELEEKYPLVPSSTFDNADVAPKTNKTKLILDLTLLNESSWKQVFSENANVDENTDDAKTRLIMSQGTSFLDLKLYAVNPDISKAVFTDENANGGQSFNLSQFNNDILSIVFSFLQFQSIGLTVNLVCKRFHELAESPNTWRAMIESYTSLKKLQIDVLTQSKTPKQIFKRLSEASREQFWQDIPEQPSNIDEQDEPESVGTVVVLRFALTELYNDSCYEELFDGLSAFADSIYRLCYYRKCLMNIAPNRKTGTLKILLGADAFTDFKFEEDCPPNVRILANILKNGKEVAQMLQLIGIFHEKCAVSTTETLGSLHHTNIIGAFSSLDLRGPSTCSGEQFLAMKKFVEGALRASVHTPKIGLTFFLDEIGGESAKSYPLFQRTAVMYKDNWLIQDAERAERIARGEEPEPDEDD